MAIEASIHTALEQHLRAFAEPRQIRVARQGYSFTPPTRPEGDRDDNTVRIAATYLRAAFMPNRNVDTFIRDEDQPARQGLFQVSVIAPTGQGVTEALTLASQIIEHYRRVRLPANGWLTRVVDAPWYSPPMQEASQLQIPVTVPWMAHEL